MADLFELSASLVLDTSQYEAGLLGAKNIANKTLGGIKGFVLDGVKQLALQAVNEIPRVAVGFAKNVLSHGLALDESLGAVYALTDAEDELAKKTFELTVLEEARQSIFDASEVAEGGMYEALAGYDFEDVTKGLHGLIVTAEAAGEPLKPVSDILTDLITAFGEEADEQMHYGDVLAATATNSNTTILKMGQTLKYVSPVAASLGYSIEDVSIAIGVLADQGIKGSQAGTAFRNIMTRIATDAGATSNKLGALGIITEELGVNFYDTYGNARPFLEFLTDARKAWNGMSAEGRNAFFDSFGDYKLSAEEADEALLAFQEDVKTVSDLYQEYLRTGYDEYDAQIHKIAGTYRELFESLNIDFGSSPGELADAMEKASVSLGVMNDEEQISYANRIGSLRAMAAWLALMNIEQGKFEELSEDIYNSEGAAEKMRDKRYDNLHGDIVHFNAALDALYDQFYFEWRSPLRDLVQAATTSINEIGDTYIAEGWDAAVDKAFSSLTVLWDKYAKPIIDKLAPAIGNALIKGLEWLNLEGGKIISDIAATFAGGLWDGIVNKVKGEGTSHGGLLDTLTFGLAGQIFGHGDSPGDEYELGDVNGALGYVKKETGWNSRGGGAGRSLSTSIQDWFGWNDTGNEDYTIPLPDIQPIIDTETLTQQLADAGADGGDQLLENLPSPEEIVGMYPQIFTSALADAGTAGGQQAASNIQTALDGITFTVNVVGNYIGTNNMPGGAGPWRMERFAKGMSGGYIMRGATIFGKNAKGQPMVGGGEGPEAVVGTGSLDRMIQSSVNAAINGLLSRMDAMVDRMTGYEPRVYLDTGALVGGMVNGINSELNDITRWRGSGRT